LKSIPANHFHAARKIIGAMILGAIRVDNPTESEDLTASMDKSMKSNKINKKFEDLRNLPCPFHKGAKQWRPSVGNSKS
jgi:hypothetical protein